MKRFLSVLAVCLAFAGCRQNALPTVEGQVTDATIHSVTLETPEGESVTLSTLGTDPMLVPGVLAGDAVRVAYELLPDGETMRAVRLDITAPSAYRLIPGIWRDCSTSEEVGLVLAEDGSAEAVGLEGVSLRDWSLDGRQLALSATGPADASRTLLYSVETLTVDSLVLSPVEGGMRRLFLSRQP